MKIYHYHPITGVYTATTDALPDPAYPGQFIVPAHATAMAPPTVSGSFDAAVFRAGAWIVMPDYTPYQLFTIADAQPYPNTLKVGDSLPQGVTTQDPTGFDYPRWDGISWVEDGDAKAMDAYLRELMPLKTKFEETLRLLEDDTMRSTVPGLKVMSAPHEQDLHTYLQEMDAYIETIELAGPTRVGTLSLREPVFPLQGAVDKFNLDLFDTQARASSQYAPTLPWQPNTRFEAGQLVYGTNGEGLYVVVAGYVSHPQMSTDITAGDLVPAMPNQPGLRYAPVDNLAELAALAASDYAICKVKDTGFEYVFHLGLATGDVPDNNSTGFWNRVASGSGGGAGGNFRAFEGQTATSSSIISVGLVGFTVSEMLVFVNGSLRLNTEYTYDAGTGEITLNAAMQPNDTWKVLLMS